MVSRSWRWNCVPYRKPGAIKCCLVLERRTIKTPAAPGLPWRSWVATLSCGAQRAPLREIVTMGLCCAESHAPNSHNPPHTDTSPAQGSFGKKELKRSWIYQTLEGKNAMRKSAGATNRIHPPRTTTDNRPASKRDLKIHILKLWKS